MAIITRCRMPPENSCGYMSTRCAGLGDPHAIEHRDRSAARLRLAHALDASTSTSVSCRLTVR